MTVLAYLAAFVVGASALVVGLALWGACERRRMDRWIDRAVILDQTRKEKP